MNLILKWLIFVNGIYDLLCAVAILLFPNTLIGKLHLSIFNKNIHCHVNIRLLAYWIITYGYIRLFILQQSKCINILVALTYFIEAIAYVYEDIYYNTTIKYKTAFISISSLIIGSLLLC
jgi:hypothetical protein